MIVLFAEELCLWNADARGGFHDCAEHLQYSNLMYVWKRRETVRTTLALSFGRK